jgi:hypothetical protein
LQPANVPPPPKTQCQVSWQSTTLMIEEPPVTIKQLLGYPLLLFLVLGLPFAAVGLYGHFFDTPSPVNANPLLASALVLLLLLVIFLAVVAVSMPQLYRRHLVLAEPTGVRFITEGWFAKKQTTIRSVDIVELRIALGHLAVITPRDWRVVCGRLDQLLARAELEWLREQMMLALKL